MPGGLQLHDSARVIGATKLRGSCNKARSVTSVSVVSEQRVHEPVDGVQ